MNRMTHLLVAFSMAQATWASVVTSYEYSDAGDVLTTKVVDSSTSTTLSRTEAEYDVLGRQIRVTQAMVVSGDDIQQGFVTHSDYDVAGNLVTKKVDTGGTPAYMMTVYVYDDLGRQVTAKGPSTNVDGSNAPQAIYEYDANGNAIQQSVRVNNADGQAITSTAYDALNRAVTVTGPENNDRVTTYDSHGRSIKECAYQGSASSGTMLQQTRILYDHVGRVLRRTRFNLIPERDPDDAEYPDYDSIVEYTYDRGGRVLSETTYDYGYPARALVTQSQYDGLGRLTKRIDPKGYYDQMDYDSRGFVVTATRHDTEDHKTVMAYDNRGRMTRSIAKGTPDLTTAYAYDGVGRRTLVTDPSPSGRQTYYEYDLAGHQTKLVEDWGTGRLNRTTEYIFDKQGRLWKQIAHNDSGQLQQTTYGYDANGQQATITYPDNGVLAFDYYPNGAVSRRTDQAAIVLEYAYDLRGLMTAKQQSGSTTYVFNYSYDGLGRMLTAAGPYDQYSVAQSEVVYAYDGLGRRINDQQKTSSTQPAPLDVVSEYDQAGNRIRLSYP